MSWPTCCSHSIRSDMPELLEVEAYAGAALAVVGRTVSAVDAGDTWYLKGGTTRAELEVELDGAVITGVRRIGKLMLVDTDGPILGLRFGMTGRLMIDGSVAIGRLEYSSRRRDPAWTRFALDFDEGGRLSIDDPRRLGGVELDPDESRLGPDAASIDRDELASRISGRAATVKAVLLDQHRIAGLGNLLVDETLWRAGIAPGRRARDLTRAELSILHEKIVETIAVLRARGGSHTGDLQEFRVVGASCPRDGADLSHDSTGGRSTYWCPVHQV